MRRTILSAFVVLLTAMAGPAAAAELPGSFTLRKYAGAGPATSRTAKPRVFPARSRLRAVRDYLRGRAGIESWALIDSRGREHGWAPHRTYVSASLVKAMLLVARLRAIAPARPSAADRALLGPMITESDNDRADAVYALVGDAALFDLARRAHMRDFSVAGYWSERALQRARPGPLLPPHRPDGAAALTRVRARAAVLDRPMAALGLLALCARRTASRRS